MEKEILVIKTRSKFFGFLSQNKRSAVQEKNKKFWTNKLESAPALYNALAERSGDTRLGVMNII